ncbi:MarR family winged helix-turn-helix transcriptional regulator [Agromyces mangrovi Wang et al. 2018]|uniref:MarR family winged helix-turn-helix transcriptional regulator n=1 Tax=Agromyces mangrovi TaxID=1858653 RepID=UPI002572C171|nr:MarR family winged helix-turn-helix transcriptional regulator [Agromyces mangrovi]BDZ65237.1 transcriptional regulator [Agromyces mangrovi]
MTADTPELERALGAVETQLGVLFNRVRVLWKEQAASVHPDLQPVGYKLLSALVRGGPAHAGALADQLATDKSVVSRQVRILADLGLVESRVDEHDARARLLVATSVGVERVQEVRSGTQSRLRARLAEWPEGDVERFAELLARMNEG